MNVSLTPELEKFVHDKIDSGLYTSASEVVRESLRLMLSYEDIQKQRIDQLNNAIEVSLTQLKAGNKVQASDSYQRLQKKIKDIAKKRK